jgi:hypothetical protein
MSFVDQLAHHLLKSTGCDDVAGVDQSV